MSENGDDLAVRTVTHADATEPYKPTVTESAAAEETSANYDNVALSGYLLRERRHSVSEYCQPLGVYVDVLMYMMSFKNVDLLKQGWYQVRVSISDQSGSTPGIQQLPVILSKIRSKYKDERFQTLNCRLSNTVSNSLGENSNTNEKIEADNEHAFYTDATRIKYMWESNELDHLVKFRLELPVTQTQIGQVILEFKFELLFSPFEANEKRLNNPSPSGELKPVSTKTYRLSRIGVDEDGLFNTGMSINEYLLVTWDNSHVADMDVMIHTAFTGYTTTSMDSLLTTACCVPKPSLPSIISNTNIFESSFGCYLSSTEASPISIADLIQAFNHKLKDAQKQNDSGQTHHRDHRCYMETARSLLSPLFHTLDTLERLNSDTASVFSRQTHQQQNGANDGGVMTTNDDPNACPSGGRISSEVDLGDVLIDNNIEDVVDKPITDRREVSRKDEHTSAIITPNKSYSNAVQRAVFQANIDLAIEVVVNYMKDLTHYDERLQFLGKLCGAISRRMISEWGYFITHYMENTKRYHAFLKGRWVKKSKIQHRQFVVYEDDFTKDAMENEECIASSHLNDFEEDAMRMSSLGTDVDSIDWCYSPSSSIASTPRTANRQLQRALLHSISGSKLKHLVANGKTVKEDKPELESFYYGMSSPSHYTKLRKNREKICNDLAKINKRYPDTLSRFLQDNDIVRHIDKIPTISIQKIPGKSPISLQNKSINRAVDVHPGRVPCHLFVFVHGLLGHSTDLRIFRDALSSKHFVASSSPVDSAQNFGNNANMVDQQRTYQYLMSRSNQGHTFDSFECQGERLATEIHEFINWTFDEGDSTYLDRISFIGHSIGNIVIRSALRFPTLEMYKPLFWGYTSISGPHLGYTCSDNFLLNSGMKVLERFHSSESLSQLSMKDNKLGSIQDGTDAEANDLAFLQELSQHDGLSWFSHVVLVASQQDRYVPYHSARIEMPPIGTGLISRSTKLKLSIIDEMIVNIIGKMLSTDGTAPKGSLAVVDVNFSQIGVDFIGRKAHIEFLHNRYYIESMIWTLDSIYE